MDLSSGTSTAVWMWEMPEHPGTLISTLTGSSTNHPWHWWLLSLFLDHALALPFLLVLEDHRIANSLVQDKGLFPSQNAI